MRNGEERYWMRGEDSLFLAENLDPDSQDRTVWRGLVAVVAAYRLSVLATLVRSSSRDKKTATDRG